MAVIVTIRHRFERMSLDVDLSLSNGLTALLGPSGAGKTRTLDTIAGLFRAEHVRIAIDEDVLADTAAKTWVAPHKRHVGYVFQDARLFPHLTVRQNLEYGRWFARRRSGHHSVGAVVELLGLAPLLTRHPARLSGGEARRVALGRTLLSAPRLLLLDEPLGSLEMSRRQEILPYLDALMAEYRIPIIYVTHDWDEVRGRADRIVHMDAGRARTAAITENTEDAEGPDR
jgi:molybdate transport system ATP-binding protein